MATSGENDANISDDFKSSKLGTKEYWDDAYQKELENFTDTGDVGEVWFGYDSIQRVTRWIEKCNVIREESSILDLGCGNGMMLVELYNLGYKAVCGVDYSSAAIELAKKVASEQQTDIRYQTCDILSELPNDGDNILSQKFDVCVDKGTYDAISLNPKNPQEQRLKYVKNVLSFLKDNGLLIITSCNWTEQELTQHFKEGFKFYQKIPAPSFQFGGKVGNRESVLVFQKQ